MHPVLYITVFLPMMCLAYNIDTPVVFGENDVLVISSDECIAALTATPTSRPSASPTLSPTISPSASPTATSTISPSASPTAILVDLVTLSPTNPTTIRPTLFPTPSPTLPVPIVIKDKSDASESSSGGGMGMGVAAGAGGGLLLLIIVVAIIAFKIRKMKKTGSDPQERHITLAQPAFGDLPRPVSHSVWDDEDDNGYLEPKQNSGTYARLVRDENGENVIYDERTLPLAGDLPGTPAPSSDNSESAPDADVIYCKALSELASDCDNDALYDMAGDNGSRTTNHGYDDAQPVYDVAENNNVDYTATDEDEQPLYVLATNRDAEDNYKYTEPSKDRIEASSDEDDYEAMVPINRYYPVDADNSDDNYEDLLPVNDLHAKHESAYNGEETDIAEEVLIIHSAIEQHERLASNEQTDGGPAIVLGSNAHAASSVTDGGPAVVLVSADTRERTDTNTDTYNIMRGDGGTFREHHTEL